MENRMMRIAGRSKDGLAKAVRVDEEGRLAMSYGETFATGPETRQVTVAVGEVKTLFTVTKPINLTHFVWTTDSASMSISFSVNGIPVIGDIYPKGGDSMPLRAVNIVNGSSDLFEVNRYKDGDYKFTLKGELLLTEGLEVKVSNTLSEVPAKVSVRAFGVIYND